VRYFDAHVHLHPPRLATAITEWFARENWHAAHPFEPEAVAETLSARGVERFCFFTYAHRPGMARALNQWVAETAARYPQAVALGTLHPGDADLAGVVRDAIDELGLRGFKFHCSVQQFSVDDERLFPLYERAEAEGLCFVLHAGTMP
jgi:predicted TIM-barrel fold metal-dependent hydrolase